MRPRHPPRQSHHLTWLPGGSIASGPNTAPPTTLTITVQPSSTVTSGVAFPQQPVVQVRDATGTASPTPGIVVTATQVTGNATLTGTVSVVTDATGKATFTDLVLTGGTPEQLQFSSPNLTSVLSVGITVISAATKLGMDTQPSASVGSGTVFPVQPKVQILDGSGNPVAQGGTTVTVAINTGTGTLGGTLTAVTASSGLATFTNLKITGGSTDTLIFTASGLTSVVSNSIVVGAASKLTITQQPSGNAQSGVTFPQQPKIQVRDASNNVVSQSGISVVVAIGSGSGVLNGTLTQVTDTAGLATYTDLSITGIVTDTLQFTSGSLTSVTSSAIIVSAAGNYPNRPAGIGTGSNFVEVDFSQTPAQAPPSNDQIDNAIGSTGWTQIFFGQNYSAISDPTEPQTPPSAWQGHWPPGSYFEPQTLPSIAPFTATPTYLAHYGADVAVGDPNGGFFLTKVASSPGKDQYSVSAGIYTIGSTFTGPGGVTTSSAGQTFFIAYTFSDTTGLATGSTAYGTPFGHSIGNVGTGAIFGKTKFYASIRQYWDFPDTTYWHSISNKFLNIQGNNTLMLVESLEGGRWLHASELGNPSGGIDDAGSGVVSNNPIPIQGWNQVEIFMDLAAGTWQVWLNGALTSSRVGNFPFLSTAFESFGNNAFRGGGGEYLGRDINFRYGHFYVAW